MTRKTKLGCKRKGNYIMLLYPSINKLNEKTDSRYTLVMLASKRARDLIDKKPVLIDCEYERPVTQASYEIYADLITYSRPEGIE